MWLHFYLQHAHFAIHLALAGACFSILWLYADAWRERKSLREGIKLLGYFFLGCSYLISATHLSSPMLDTSLSAVLPSHMLSWSLQIVGYFCLVGSLVTEPLQDRPSYAQAALALPISVTSQMVAPILSSIVGFLYMRRATVGLEHHIKKVSFGFFLISMSNGVGQVITTTQPQTMWAYTVVSPFGMLWIIQHILLLVASLLLYSWVFSYLLKRFQSQVFIFFLSAILAIFLFTSVAYTSLLLSRMKQDAIQGMQTNVKVLSYALEHKQQQLLSDVQAIAQHPQLIDMMNNPAKKPLSDLLHTQLLAKKHTSLIVTSAQGMVIARGEEREKRGDNLDTDPMISRALAGIATMSAQTISDPLYPKIEIAAAIPIIHEASIAGSIRVASRIDDAFVDGIKKATGLSASIYSKETISATTLTQRDKSTRLIGYTEKDPQILTTVLKEGKEYAGTVVITGKSHLAAYTPIFDADHTSTGMMMVASPEDILLSTANTSLERTFFITAVLILLSIFPAYLIARSISRQVR